MKFLFDIFLVIGLPLFGMSQAPQGIPYQAIARNTSGAAIAITAVKVRFSIRDSIATGVIKYQETHNPTTSALGLFSVNVGMGTVVSGTFSGINWGKNAKFLQVELNTTGGTTYTDLGTTQMMSVPYALYAGFAANTSQPNANYTPSADSVLTLVGATKLTEGSYTVPSNETWKIVSITLPASQSTTYKVYYSGCNFRSGYGSNPFCIYSGDLYSVKIGSLIYSEALYFEQQEQFATNCSQCPPFFIADISMYKVSNYAKLQMPMWANGGEQLSVGPLFTIYVEKYR